MIACTILNEVKKNTDKIIYFQLWAHRAYKFTNFIREKILNEILHIQNSPYTYVNMNMQQLGKCTPVWH